MISCNWTFYVQPCPVGTFVKDSHINGPFPVRSRLTYKVKDNFLFFYSARISPLQIESLGRRVSCPFKGVFTCDDLWWRCVLNKKIFEWLVSKSKVYMSSKNVIFMEKNRRETAYITFTSLGNIIIYKCNNSLKYLAKLNVAIRDFSCVVFLN